MSLYGEFDPQFRPRPGSLRLLLVCASSLLLGLIFAGLVDAVIDLVMARAAGVADPLAFHGPLFGRSVLFSTPPAPPLYAWTPLAQSAVTLLLAIAITHLWPTEQTFATRIFAQMFSLSLVARGVLGWGFERSSRFDAVASMPLYVRVLLIGLGAWAAMIIERRAVETAGNLFTTDTPLLRFRLWAVRLLVPGAVFAAMAWFSQDSALALALVTILAVTLLENLSHLPKVRHERLGHPYMREAAVTLPLVAIALAAGSVYAFGWPPIDREARGVMIDGTSVRVERTIALRRSLHLTDAARRAEEKRLAEELAPEERIKIRWSKDRPKEEQKR